VWFKNTFPYVVNPAMGELFRREFGTAKKRS
jgi:hypothetical protein